jgi:hypothetical protein
MTTLEQRHRSINDRCDRLEARDDRLANTPLEIIVREALEESTDLNDWQIARAVENIVPKLERRTRVLAERREER